MKHKAYENEDFQSMSNDESSMAGYYNSEIVPYLKGISVACESGLYEIIIMVMGEHMSKTEFLLNRAGYVISSRSEPIAFVFPNKGAAESFSKKRLNKMIQNVPELKNIYNKRKSTVTDKYFNDSSIELLWCTSNGILLGSGYLKDAYIDDLDLCPKSIPKVGGDPVTLLRTKGVTCPDFLLIATSTPTAEDSPIVNWWNNGTKFKFHWTCPFCNKEFFPHSDYLKWSENKPSEAFLECPFCSSSIQEMHKQDLNKNGVYRTEYTEEQIKDMKIGSYWISGLCSPWRSFGQMAEELHDAKQSKNQKKIKEVLNKSFGEYIV